MPRLVQGPLRPDLLLVRGRPQAGGFGFTSSIGWSAAASRAAGEVLVLVDDQAPDLGLPRIPGNIVKTVECGFIDDEPPWLAPRPEDIAIGKFVASLVPAGATIQYGPGRIAHSVIEALESRVRVWGGLATDALVRLADKDLLLGRATATYMWGGQRLASMAASGMLQILPLEETHDMATLTTLDRFVAINTALEVGLDGSVNVERVAGRTVAGIGGHADFCAAASFNPSGLSVIALRSQHRDRSTIVARLPVVSTPRSDVDVVVTEHGMAWLRDADDAERARRLIAIAAPAHREMLSVAAGAGGV
jgi:acyl-CoA hydrolase